MMQKRACSASSQADLGSNELVNIPAKIVCKEDLSLGCIVETEHSAFELNKHGNSSDSVISWRKLCHADYQKCSVDLSKYLLGKILVRVFNGETLTGRIVETEAYLGEVDKACHSFGGKRTVRTEAMYMCEGTSYVYSIYGMYCCLNISSSTMGGCSLIRALEPVSGLHVMAKNRSLMQKSSSKLKVHQLCNGPSKLCIALQITKDRLNMVNMALSNEFYVADDGFVCGDVVHCKRIGIEGYGLEWASKPLRYYLKGNLSVSKKNKVAEAACEIPSCDNFFL